MHVEPFRASTKRDLHRSIHLERQHAVRSKKHHGHSQMMHRPAEQVTEFLRAPRATRDPQSTPCPVEAHPPHDL